MLGDWADFIKRADPYVTVGCLKPQWMKFVELLDAKQEMVRTKLPVKTNALNKASNTMRISIKEDMSPDQIPLPPLLLVQSTAYTDNKSPVGKVRDLKYYNRGKWGQTRS